MPVIEISGSGLHPLSNPEAWARWMQYLTEQEAKVLLFLHDRVPEGGGVYEEDPKILAKTLGLSQMGFSNVILRLQKLGALSIDTD